jgi:hypothetical protein
MHSHIFQAVWPIEDGRFTNRDLIAEATGDLKRLAAQAHARLVGPPVWVIHPAADVPGFHAHAPGRVLIARAPAVPAPAVHPTRQVAA